MIDTIESHDFRELIQLFDACFGTVFNTRLQSGGSEPEYLPAESDGQQHVIVFAHDYFQSALHEIAHWCLAGERRRLLPDYGYWYEADGRDAEQQTRFEAAEVAPQAIEAVLTQACGLTFRPSADNLDGEGGDGGDFQQAINLQVERFRNRGLPPRAASFEKILRDFYKPQYSQAKQLSSGVC